MTDGGTELSERIVQQGRQVVVERLRAAFAHQTAMRRSELQPARLEQMIEEAADRAGAALWRRSLAQAAMDELDLDLPAALAHPAVASASELVGAPGGAGLTEALAPALPAHPALPTLPEFPASAPPAANVGEVPAPPTREPSTRDAPEALRLGAVHVNGIETLRAGDRDIELRLSDAGLDVLKRSSGVAIGRLEWGEIETIDLPPPRRGLRGRRRARELHVSTGRGQAQFELPGLTDAELHEHVEPLLARLRGISQTGSG